jgi:hypothetical protein
MRATTRFAFVLALAAAGVPLARADEGKASAVTFEKDVSSFDAVLAKAKAEKKPVFLDFTSPT